MKLRRPPKRQQPETIVALIDVVFFLLVFFMLVGRMDATAPFEVSPPVGLTGQDLPGGGITVAISDSGALAVDGRATSRSETIGVVRRRLDDTPEVTVRINAHAEGNLRTVLPLIAELEEAGARDVVLVVTPRAE